MAACSEVPVVDELSVETPPDSHLISETQALQHLEGVLSAIDKMGTRASSGPRSVRNLTAVSRADLGMASTRSGESPDRPLVYLVAFGEGEGSAILAATDRLDPVIAIYDTYQITENDLRLNTMVEPEEWRTEENLYCEEEEDYYLGRVDSGPYDNRLMDIENTFLIDYLAASDLSQGGGASASAGGSSSPKEEANWVVVNYVAPMLTTEWHQNSPFNDLIPGKYPAGCVAIALAQIMAYHEYPKNYCNWALAKKYDSNPNDPDARRELAQLSKKIGAPFTGVGMSYNFCWSGQSFATPVAAKKYLRRIGYMGTERSIGYDSFLIVHTLKKGCPVFIGALTPGCSGHAWVIDGFLEYSNAAKSPPKSIFEAAWRNSSFYMEKIFLHCNWGWGKSKKNGYYASGVFNTLKGRVEESEMPQTRSGNYTWWFRIVTYDKPR